MVSRFEEEVVVVSVWKEEISRFTSASRSERRLTFKASTHLHAWVCVCVCVCVCACVCVRVCTYIQTRTIKKAAPTGTCT